MANKKARILQAFVLEGLQYKPDQVIEADAATIKSLKEAGNVDDHREAVAYAESQGARALVHVSEAERAAAAERTQAEADLAALREQFAAETDAAKKSALGEQIAAAEAALK